MRTLGARVVCLALGCACLEGSAGFARCIVGVSEGWADRLRTYTHTYIYIHIHAHTQTHIHIYIHMEKNNRGFAFVRFKDATEAMAAKAALHETPIGKEEYK